MYLTERDVKKVVEAISESSGYDFTEYSEKSITRRIEKVLNDNNIPVKKFLSKLKNKKFLERIVKDITVNTTEMFRDPEVWIEMKREVFAKLKSKDSIRIWHPGCSTGFEVYSMLILLEELGLSDKAEVYGSDINTDVLDIAANGKYKYQFNFEYLENFYKVFFENIDYSEAEKNELSNKYLNINEDKDFIEFKDFLIDKPVFFKHDLVAEDDHFKEKFDLIVCRNVLIYFNNDLQNRIFKYFYELMNDKAILIIGLHETILGRMTEKLRKEGKYYYVKKQPEF